MAHNHWDSGFDSHLCYFSGFENKRRSSIRYLVFGNMPNKDINIRRETSRRHYQAHKEEYKKRARAYSNQQRKLLRNYIWDYLLEHSCLDCGEKNPIVLQFDHLRDKKYTIADISQKSVSLETLKKEIEKCEVRCANCHMKKTALERGWWADKLA